MLFKIIYSFGKPNSLGSAIREFTQDNNNFSEACERFIALSRRYPIDESPSCKLVQTFYGGFTDNEKNMVDISGGSFIEMYIDEFMKFIER